MIVKSVNIYVKSSNVNEFIKATIENQQKSRKESGIECFDFFQCEDDPTRFLLYEIYSSHEAMDEHLKTEHSKKWNNIVEQYFSSPIDRVTYIPIS